MVVSVGRPKTNYKMMSSQANGKVAFDHACIFYVLLSGDLTTIL